MNRPRLLALVLAGAIALSFIGLRGARTQSTGLRSVTNTSEEGVNINPSISGDGRVIAFESTEDVAQAGGTDHFRAIRANITPATATLFQISGTRAVAPAISQDGSRIAFSSKDDPLGTNPDGNSEIFLFDGVKLIQVTNTSPGDVANRVTNGNFQPSITDDGRFIAFSSNRDLAAQNSDGNLEIFIYDATAGRFTQLTDSSGIVGASDAKISGNGGSVAYIRDAGATPSAKRDLFAQPRVGPGPVTVLAFNVQALAMTYGRAISDDGTRVVYSAETATNSTQVFLFDGRDGAATRQITSLGVRATEVPLHPTISGDGLRIAFATRRSVSGTTSNSDGSVELYVFDIPSSQVSKITDVPSGVAADVLSSLDDDGSIVAFNFPRVVSGVVLNGDSANNSEIYVTGTPARPPFGAITVLNGAAFGKEPSPNKAVAPDSIAVAIGAALANSTQQPQRLPNGTFPTDVGGTTVMVDGRAAQIFFVSPGQVNFLVPPQTEIGTADVSVTNSENFTSRGAAPILRAAPGVFTSSGDGTGPGVILNSETLQEGPFDPTDGNLPLTIFTTGARNATQNLVVIGGRVIAAESVVVSPDMPGLDEVLVFVPRDLRGAGTVDLFVQSDGRASNPVAITFTGDGTRDILLNEVLSDPPGAAAVDVQGDANHDGVRSGNDDEFVELVNTTTGDIDLSGYQLLTRNSSTTTDTLRHTFAASTIIPACTAVVVFGGGAFDASNPAFGGSKVVKASSGALSLSNTEGVLTLRDHASAIVTSLSYGGSTGLNGNAGQALTRAPDKTGIFVLHQTASGSGGRSFSPGTQLNGDPFAVCNTFVRIDVSPSSAAIDAGAKQQFTAKAIGANGNEVPGVIFSWQSSDPLVATIAQNGLATSSIAGATEIRAAARGTQSAPVTLTVREVPRVLTRVDVTPLSATSPATGAQQFTAKGIDQFGNEITGLAFAWESSNPTSATIDQTGLASGISQGQSTIKATTRSISGTATLNVTVPTIVVNEVLADPPTGADGDANHDGIRDSGDDEFVELVNSTSSPMNISGWTVRTHSTISSTETVRHTFAANTTLPAAEAMVVFGGGTANPAHPLFGCAQVVKASSGGLSLSNGGLTILVRDGSGNLITQFPYGGSTGLNGGNAQSLTRSPDITGSFVLHTTLAGARKSSSGLKVDGMPFGNCTLLTINDVTLNEGNSSTTTFTFTVSLSTPAPPGGVTFDIATQDSTATVANNDYVARSLTEQTIGAGQQTYSFDVTVNGDVSIEPGEAFFLNVTNVSGALVADGQGVGTILNDDSPALSINEVTANEGTAGTTTFTFTVTSTLPAPAGGITFDIATADGTATTAGGDYVARSLAGQTIAGGQTSYTFDVTVNGDMLFEPNETFFVNVTNVSGAGVSDSQGVGTIQNDDTALVDISQLYAGGGNSGATYKNDFIEVFNRSNTTVDLTGWSVQYTSAAGIGTWSVTPLCAPGPCLLLPGHYFLVQEDQGAGGTTNLPTPDAIGTISMTTGAGKVALRLSTTPLSGACPSSTSILDVVGYGSSATCFEGTGPAAAPGNATSVLRKSGGCTDTNDNAADTFVSGPSPRNSAAAVNDCNAPATLTSVTITPLLATIGVGYTQQFMGQALDQFGQPIGGVTVSFASNDANIATVDSASPTSGTGSATATVNGRGTGSAEIKASATNGSTNVTGSAATLTVEPAAGQVLISEFCTRGPAGAADEFIEIYNPTASPVVIGGLKIRASTSTGTPSDRVTITAGTILGPGCHYLVANNTAGTGYSGATPPDRTYTTAIADNGGIAITRSDNTVLDAVGMNATSAYQEGTVLNPMTGSANQSYERKPGGASGNGVDINNNANDFVLNAASSNPQNSASGCLATNTADVAIAETDSPDPVTVGSDITYSITVTNNGIGTAQSVAVTDNLPPGLTYVSCNSTGSGLCDGTGNSRSINFSSLAVGSAATITLAATVNGTGGAIISNTTSVSAATADSNSSNNSATATTTVSPADLSITKLDSPDPVDAGENITYTLVVTNNSSTIPARSVTLTDQVPANTTFVSSGATPAGWTRTDATAVGQTGSITFTRSTLPANGTATFTITVKVDSSTANNSNISNTATVNSNTPDDNSVNNSATQTTTVRTPADLSINKTVNNASPNVGEQVTFTITVSNSGPYAATGVSVKDQIPAGQTYVSDDGAGFYVDSTGIWTVGTVNASATATLHITAQTTSTAVNGATNTAELVASDQFDPDSTPNNHNNGEDDQASASVTAQSANLSLTKTVDNSSPNVGQDVTFTITLNNAGPNAATNVQVKDLLPAGLTFVSSTQSQGSYISSSGIWTVGSVNASGSATLTITVSVPSAGLITNIAEVAACDVFDPNSTPNNHNAAEDDQAGRTISSLQADLSLLKSVDNPAPNVGGNVVFTIAVTNVGPSAATNVQVKDLLPTGLTYVSDDGGGAYASGTGVWTVGTVNASATTTLHIAATATSASVNGVTNTAEVIASDVPDPDSTPNNHIAEDDQSSVTVNAKDADLSLVKTVDNGTPGVGDTVMFTVRISNTGSDAATGVQVSDSLPTGLSFISSIPSQGSYDDTTGVWTVGTVSVGSHTATLTINATATTAGAKTNTAEIIASGVFDPDSTPNNHSAPEDDQSGIALTVHLQADLSLAKTVDTASPVVGQNIVFTVTLHNAGPSTATGVQVADLLASGLLHVSSTVTQGSYDSGTGVWSVGTVNSGASPSLIITAKVTTQGAKTNTATISASDVADPNSGNNQSSVTFTPSLPLLVISQIYTAGGAASAIYNRDFIEIFNRGTVSINLSGFTVQYAATGTGTFTVIASLPNATLAPRQYFLISAGTTNAAVGASLPVTVDVTGSNTNMTGSVGKVAVVFGTSALTSANVNNPPLTVGNATPGCPTSASIVVDFIGYGTTAACYEGTSPAPDPTSSNNSQADFRNNGGCADTNDNSSNFTRANVVPRNSSTTKASCP
jgi:uncharacterized repeat protein (TIGR01451 family)